MILFLDFDGVLTLNPATKQTNFADCLRWSSDEEEIALTELRKHFSSYIAARIVGVMLMPTCI